ncbi:MAG: chromate transporter, partial [Terrimicrobiaceae bacterium]
MSEVAEPSRPTLFELAKTFNHIALASFGGGLSAWSREVVVVEKKWMPEEEFLSAITMCRILPGANQVNLAVFVGSKFRGMAGAAAAVFGLSLV